MSDTVAKAGIEDVLSSVKRLVSEEGRAVPNAETQTISRKPGRLVLTDALRIRKPTVDQPSTPPAVSEYSAEDSARPMLLRACDIVRAGTPANKDRSQPKLAEDSGTDPLIEPAQQEDPAVSLSAKIEALEAAIARTEDQWEPDGDSDDAYSGTPNRALPWNMPAGFTEAEVVDAKIEPAPANSPEAVTWSDTETAKKPEPEPAEQQPDAVTLDQEALRALIAEVVREELQGALGERITRNVRKMVRREINRALTEKDLS